jgi:hypothetical protein
MDTSESRPEVGLLESFEMCWRRKEKIIWTERVKKTYYEESRRKGTCYIYIERRVTGFVTSFLETVN